MIRMISRKILIRVAINTIIGLVLIYVWTRFVDFNEVLHTLSDVKLEYIGLLVLCFLLSSILRSLRLKVLLNSPKLNIQDLSLLTLLSQFLSFMIPVRAGELTKGVYLSTQLQRPFPTTVVWVFIDRFIDFYQVILLILISLLLVPTGLPSKLVYGSLFLLLIMSIFVFIIIRNNEYGRKIIKKVSGIFILDSISRYFVIFSNSILDGFEILNLKQSQWIKVMLITFLAFLIDGIFWWLVFLSIGLDVGLVKGVLGNDLIALTFLIPAAPGYVGSAEASGLAVWSGVLDVPSNIASTGTILFHIVTVVTLLIFGLISLYLLNFDLNEVWKKLKK